MFTRLAITAAILAALSGCAWLPSRQLKPAELQSVVVYAPCPAAGELPDEPQRYLVVSTKDPGDLAVKVVVNRLDWIGYGDVLRAKLASCN